MKQENIVGLANLLNTKPDVIESIITKDESFDSVINKFKEDNKIFKNDEFNTLLENSGRSYVENLVKNNTDIPKVLYDKVKGTILEMEEKELKKTYEFDGDYKGFRDLQSKIIDKIKSEKVNDDTTKKEIEKLKKIVKQVEEEKETIRNEERSKREKYIVDAELTKIFNTLKIDAADDVQEKQRKMVQSVFLNEHTIKIENDKLIASNKDGILKDRVGDPMSLNDVIKEFAPKWVKIKSDDGGRGDGSSINNKGVAGIKDANDFNKHLQTNNINPNSVEAAKILSEIRKTNPNFKL